MKKILLKKIIFIISIFICLIIMPLAAGCSYDSCDKITDELGLSGCTYDPYTGFSVVSSSEPKASGKYDDNDIDGTADTFGSSNFGYEKAAAVLYYHKDTEDLSLPDSTHNVNINNFGSYDFDDTGFGVFVVRIPEYSHDGHNGYYIEFTTDYGETWKVCEKGFESTYYVAGVRVRDRKVYIIRRSGIDSDSYIMYSDNLCKSFKRINPVSMLPQFEGQLDGMTTNLMLLTIDDADGSLVLAWDSGDECESEKIGDDPEYQFAWGHRKLFLIVKTDSELKRCQIVYSDTKYIRNKAYEIEHYE